MDAARIAEGFSYMCVIVLSLAYSWYSAVELTSHSASSQKHDPILVRKPSVYEPGNDSGRDLPYPPLIKRRKLYQQVHSVYVPYPRPRQARWRIASPPCFDPCDF